MKKYDRLKELIENYNNTKEYKDSLFLEIYNLYYLSYRETCKGSEINKENCNLQCIFNKNVSETIIQMNFKDVMDLLENKIIYDSANNYISLKHHTIKDKEFIKNVIDLINKHIKDDIDYLIKRKYIVRIHEKDLKNKTELNDLIIK